MYNIFHFIIAFVFLNQYYCTSVFNTFLELFIYYLNYSEMKYDENIEFRYKMLFFIAILTCWIQEILQI